jgi:uncharacterized protein with beta-barrel porin domain
MNDATGAANVTVTAGNLIMNDISNAAGILAANGGVTTVRNVVGNVAMANASTVNVSGNIGGTVDGAGKLVLNSTAGNQTISGLVGNVTKVTTIELAGIANTTFSKAVKTDTILFSGSNSITVEFDDSTDLGASLIKSTSTADQTIILNKATTLTKAVGEATHKVNLKLKGGIELELNSAAAAGTDLANSAILSTENNQNTLKIGKDGTKVGSAGDATNKLAALNFVNTGEVTNDAYATLITVDDTKTATFGGVVGGTNLKLQGVNSAVIFKPSSTLATNLLNNSGTNEKGKVTFSGSATLNNVIGLDGSRFESVKFTGGAAASSANIVLAQDIHSKAIEFSGVLQNITAANSVKLDGLTTFSKTSNIKLGNNVVTATGAGSGIVLTGDVKLSASVTNDMASNGKIKVANGASLSFKDLKSLVLDVRAPVLLPSQSSVTFDLIDNSTGAAVQADSVLDLSIVDQSMLNVSTSLSKLVASIGKNGGLVLTQLDNVKEGLATRIRASGGAVTADDLRNIDILSSGTGDARKVIVALDNLDAKKSTELLDRLTDRVEVNRELENIVTDTSASISGRMFAVSPGSLGGQPIETADSGYSGVAAGDDEAGRFGVWANPFFGSATQKNHKGSAGYKSEKYGASVGFDTKANDNMIVGAAMTYLNSNIKHKNQKVGDTTKVDSVLFSLYGMQQFNDNWYGQGVATFGSNKVRNEEGRVAGALNERASAKYSSMSFGAEATIGYNYFYDEFTVTPMGGMRYTRVNDGGYRESGTAFQNLDVTKKAINKLEVVAGLRLASKPLEFNGMSITPEVHALVNHDVISKKPVVEARINGGNSALVSSNSKPVRTNYTIGTGVNFHYNMMEYGLGYDANMASKYVSHQGSVKVRVNF